MAVKASDTITLVRVNDGSNGIGISTVTEYYALSTSNSTAPTSGWSTTPQTMTATDKYLWNYEVIKKTDNSTISTAKRVIGAYGDKGNTGGTGATGPTGIGVKTVTNYYLASASSSGVTTSTNGWTTTVQNVSAAKKYLWNYEVITFTNNSTNSTTPCIIGAYGDTGSTGKGISTVTNYYLATSSSSGVTTSTSGWTTTVQSVTATNKYLWNYEKITFTDNSASSTVPCIIGAYGDKGNPGGTGPTGNGISSIQEYYQISTSNTTAPTSWVTTVPVLTATNKYLWNYEKITYTNSTTKETAKRVIGVYGDKGNPGGTGPTGNGISKTEVFYYLSTSNTSQAGGSWATTVPTWIDGRYYWQKVKTTYTNGSSSESSPVCITGGKGNTGGTGTGVQSVTIEFYLSTSKASQSGGSWTTTMPTWSSGKYLWTRNKIVYQNPTSTVYTTPICDSSWEAVNEIQVGGRNLARHSNTAFTRNSWNIAEYYISPHSGGVLSNGYGYLVANETYTISIDITPATNVRYIAPNQYAYVELCRVFTDGTTNRQRICATFKMKYFPGKEPSVDPRYAMIKLYRFPNDGTVPGNSTIHSVKIEKGNKATDWTPAPEDIQDQIDSTVSKLNDIASDSKLTPNEKTTTKKEWLIIADEYSKYIAQASAYGVSTTTYTNAYNTLNSYLNTTNSGVIFNMTTTTDINSTTFTNNFKTYYNSKVELMNAITTAKAKHEADAIEIGDRNLLLKSNTNYYNDSYLTANCFLDEDAPQDGETVTIQIKGQLGAGKTGFGIYNSGGNVHISSIYPEHKKNGIYKKTFTWTKSSASNTSIHIYAMESSTVSYSTIEWVKLVRGNKCSSDWTPANGDIKQDINDAVDDSQKTITNAYTSLIEESSKQIQLMVSNIKTVVDGNATTISEISNQLQITSEMAQFIKTTTEKLQSTVDGKVDIETIKEWARFDGATLELGASNSPFKCKLTTTELAFYQGTLKVAWFSNNEMHVLRAIITSSIGVGNLRLVDEGELGFSFMLAT